MRNVLSHLFFRICRYRIYLNPVLLFKRIQIFSDSLRDQKLDEAWRSTPFILSECSYRDNSYLRMHSHIHNIEHQLGRFLNMKIVFNNIVNLISGNILEFGTWQGLGLCQLSKCLSDDIFPRKFIGIDSFEGLPESSTVWQKGMFADTSYEYAQNNLKNYFKFTENHSPMLIKGLFSDKNTADSLFKATQNVCLVHFDADLGTSTSVALKMIEAFFVGRTDSMYFLFDDWGCHPEEVPDAFHDWEKVASKQYSFSSIKIASTNHTRYYRLDFEV